MNIFLDIYNLVVQIIGQVPIELNFIYGFCTILVFVIKICFNKKRNKFLSFLYISYPSYV